MIGIAVTATRDTSLGTRKVERRAVSVGPAGNLIWGTRAAAVPLPEEWVLRELMRSNPTLDSDVLRLMERRGTLTAGYFDPAYVPEDAVARFGARAAPEVELGRSLARNRQLVTLEDARWWVKTLRAVTRIWQFAALGEPVDTCWRDEGFLGPTSTAATWAQFTRAVNIGIEVFQPRVALGTANPYPSVGLYAAACGQLFDFIAAGVVPQRCASATCSTIFVHQIGGARHGRSRTSGVRFCSPGCARAETQRQYRRRKAHALPLDPPVTPRPDGYRALGPAPVVPVASGGA
jgi:hypothetical protein